MASVAKTAPECITLHIRCTDVNLFVVRSLQVIEGPRACNSHGPSGARRATGVKVLHSIFTVDIRASRDGRWTPNRMGGEGGPCQIITLLRGEHVGSAPVLSSS